MNSREAKSIDGIKVFRMILTKGDGERSKRTQVDEQATKWEMHFSVNKCKEIHDGEKNSSFTVALARSV